MLGRRRYGIKQSQSLLQLAFSDKHKSADINYQLDFLNTI